MRIDIPGKGRIEFEGHKLSDAAKFFEFTPGFNSFPPECKRWILDLHYCWARGRSADSCLILQTCKLIEDASLSEKPALMELVRERFPNLSAEEFYDHWLRALALIRETASQREVCYWVVRSEPGEADIFLKTAIKIITMNSGFEKAPKEFKRKLNSIPNASEAEKIRFILDFTDGYTDKE